MIGFLNNEGEKPYLFVNSETGPPEIIGYTDAFKKELGLEESLIEESYLKECLFTNLTTGFEKSKKIKDFLNLEREEHFDFEYRAG